MKTVDSYTTIYHKMGNKVVSRKNDSSFLGREKTSRRLSQTVSSAGRHLLDAKGLDGSHGITQTFCESLSPKMSLAVTGW